ncbi:MAG: hypothetical protein ACI8ZN_002182 [Bacteroidia bacterium]|jgi:hypothetical protein
MTLLKRYQLLALTAVLSCTLSAQTVILEQNVNSDTIISNHGKNRKHYTGTFYDVKFAIGASEGDTTSVMKQGASWAYGFGLYRKYKISNFYSILGSAAFRRTEYQFETKDPMVYNKLILNDVSAEFSNRFNYGRRGNFIGNYVEIGASAAYTFANRKKVKTTPNDPDVNYKSRKLIYTDVNYLEPLNYYGHLRFGFNRYVVTADYRLTDLINDNKELKMPPLLLGLRIDLGA